MNVGWIAPIDTRCGIAFYAKRYAESLSDFCTVTKLDPQNFLIKRKEFLRALSGCDCVHLQYETSFFLQGHSDFYPDLCKSIRQRKIVTLHELYRTAPGVFPRDALTGPWPLSTVKKIAWDLRHPHWAAFAKHQRKKFYADVVIVHSKFQKEILLERGFPNEKIAAIPLPIRKHAETAVVKDKDALPVVLGATGFINPAYDYELLFEVLEAMTIPWRFVWVGGARRDEDERLLHGINQKIDKREWREKFTVTGWVPDEARDRLLDEMHVFCAFFKERSSSESLADAVGAKTPIIASRIALTEELARFGPVLVLAPSEPDKIAKTITEMIFDKALNQRIKEAQALYGETYSTAACCRRVVDLYEKVVSI